MISTLKFKITTKGNYTTKNDIEYKQNNIFITSSVKLTMNDLHYSYITGDYKRLFTSREYFNELVKYGISRYGALDVRDGYYKKKRNEILNNNIKLIIGIFFPVKSKFTYEGHPFIITKVTYAEGSYEILKPDIYSVPIELTLISAPIGKDHPTETDFKKLECAEKAVELEQQAYDLFGVSLNFFDKPKQIVIKPDERKLREAMIKAKALKEKEDKEKELIELRKENELVKLRKEKAERERKIKEEKEENDKKTLEKIEIGKRVE